MEKKISDINTLLKNSKWTGYIWYVSDVNINNGNFDRPKIYNNKEVPEVKIEGHNYIQELYLYDGNNIAIHSKYLGDRNQRFFVNELCDFKGDNFKIDKEKVYPSHLQKFGINEMVFQTIYNKTPTINGLASTWEPVLEFFKGFKTEENDKN